MYQEKLMKHAFTQGKFVSVLGSFPQNILKSGRVGWKPSLQKTVVFSIHLFELDSSYARQINITKAISTCFRFRTK